MAIRRACRLLLLMVLVQAACRVRPLYAAQPLPSQREIVRRAAAQRPDDPWPRGLAHVVLAIPGSQQPEKSYLEPGGSFSPAVGSFGVSIWVKDSAGNLKTSSDALPMKEIQQRFSWPDPKGVPAIATTTPHYQATWSCMAAGTTVLELQRRGDGAERLELVVRSVGPAGGPIEKIAWNERALRINDRWTLSVEPPPIAVSVGHEGDPRLEVQSFLSTPVERQRRLGLRSDRVGGRAGGEAHAWRLRSSPAQSVGLPRRAFHVGTGPARSAFRQLLECPGRPPDDGAARSPHAAG